MPREINGNLQAAGRKFALVVGRFNEFISQRLLEGAHDCLLRHGAAEKEVHVIWVPGAFEIPVAALKAAQSGKYDAIVCLGAVIRGATPHFDFVAAAAANGIAEVGLRTGIPATFGVITSDTVEQAVERAGTKAGNKGWDAALAAIEMADILPKI